MKRRRAKRKIASRRKVGATDLSRRSGGRKSAKRKVGAVAPNGPQTPVRLGPIEGNRPYLVSPNGPIDYRIALPPNKRRLSFGDRWDYTPAPEAHSYIKLKPRYELFIHGQF